MSRYKEIARVFSADELQTLEAALRLSSRCADGSDVELVDELLYLINGSFWAGQFAKGEESESHI